MSTRAPSPGDPAPDFRGTDADGETVDIVSFRPKPVLLEFHRGTW
jgi:peroxiredoxin